jgi:hypothetical protein
MDADVPSHDLNDFIAVDVIVLREALARLTFRAVAVAVLAQVGEQRDEVLVVELEQVHVLVGPHTLVERELLLRLKPSLLSTCLVLLYETTLPSSAGCRAS